MIQIIIFVTVIAGLILLIPYLISEYKKFKINKIEEKNILKLLHNDIQKLKLIKLTDKIIKKFVSLGYEYQDNMTFKEYFEAIVNDNNNLKNLIYKLINMLNYIRYSNDKIDNNYLDLCNKTADEIIIKIRDNKKLSIK
ncbi:MAG: hypothetical protein KatS3mg068_2102 [Candidatus Sericytochromatia bacterium]|nr:MAG: hypothetical protein KatS3mg068_2102 [Candidatus Sericytochromatia bacterium]